MALKGSFSKKVNSHWRVRGEWRGTQSDSGNYTDITFDVYWESIDSYGTTYSVNRSQGAPQSQARGKLSPPQPS